MVNYKEQAIRGTIIILVMSILSAALAYLYRILLAKQLGVALYGLFYSAMALINILGIFRDFGLRSAIATFMAEFFLRGKYQLAKGLIIFATYFQLVTSLIISCLLVIFSDLLSRDFFHILESGPAVRILAIVFVVMFLEQIFTHVFLGTKSLFLYSFSDPLRLGIFIATTVIFFKFSGGIMPAIYAMLFSYIILSVIYSIVFAKKIFPNFFSIKQRLNKSLQKKYFKFGLYTMINLTGVIILTNTDTIILTWFRSLKEVGLYQVAVPIAMLMLFFAQAVGKIVVPIVSELRSAKQKNHIKMVSWITQKYVFMVGLPLGLMLFFYPDIVIRVFFGEQYIAATTALRILAIGVFFYSIGAVNNSMYTGLGVPHIDTQNFVIAALANVVLNLVLVPRYGTVGAAVATMLSFLILLVVSTHRLNKLVQTNMPWGSWLKTLIAGALFALTVSYLKNVLNLWWPYEMAICAISASLVYGVALLTLKTTSFGEINSMITGKVTNYYEKAHKN